jgi:hypothetical protein
MSCSSNPLALDEPQQTASYRSPLPLELQCFGLAEFSHCGSPTDFLRLDLLSLA